VLASLEFATIASEFAHFLLRRSRSLGHVAGEPSLDEQKAKVYIVCAKYYRGDGDLMVPPNRIPAFGELGSEEIWGESGFFREVRYYSPRSPASYVKRDDI